MNSGLLAINILSFVGFLLSIIYSIRFIIKRKEVPPFYILFAVIFSISIWNYIPILMIIIVILTIIMLLIDIKPLSL